MHPEIAKVLVAQRHDELVNDTASRRRGACRPSHGRRLFPRWHVSSGPPWDRIIPHQRAESGQAGRLGAR
jgi:hypothetical protein